MVTLILSLAVVSGIKEDSFSVGQNLSSDSRLSLNLGFAVDSVLTGELSLTEYSVLAEDTAVADNTALTEDTALEEETALAEDTALVEDSALVEDAALTEDTDPAEDSNSVDLATDSVLTGLTVVSESAATESGGSLLSTLEILESPK